MQFTGIVNLVAFDISFSWIQAQIRTTQFSSRRCQRPGKPIRVPALLSNGPPSAAFETQTVQCLINTGPFPSLRGRSLTFAVMPVPSGRSMARCLGLCVRRQCLALLNTSGISLQTRANLPRRRPLTLNVFRAVVSLRSFSLTPACPGQYTQTNR